VVRYQAEFEALQRARKQQQALQQQVFFTFSRWLMIITRSGQTQQLALLSDAQVRPAGASTAAHRVESREGGSCADTYAIKSLLSFWKLLPYEIGQTLYILKGLSNDERFAVFTVELITYSLR
jgi:hypothetical protein